MIANILPGIKVKGFGTALAVAIVYSLIHFLLYRVLFLISLPFLIASFGLFVFVINAFLLWLTSQLVKDFKIDGCGTTLLASLLISLCSVLLRAVF